MLYKNQQQGVTAEALVALLLAERGYSVLTPAFGHQRFDLAVRLRNGRTLYLQVKSSSRHESDRRWQRVRLTPQRSQDYAQGDFHYYVAVLYTKPDMVEVMMIPFSEAGRHAVFTPANELKYGLERILDGEERRSD